MNLIVLIKWENLIKMMCSAIKLRIRRMIGTFSVLDINLGCQQIEDNQGEWVGVSVLQYFY